MRAFGATWSILAVVIAMVPPSFADDLTVTLVSIVSPISPGATQQLVVQTQTGTTCSGDIQGAQSAGTGKGGSVAEFHLPAVQSDDSGKVTWSWKLGMTFPKGHRTVRIVCKNGSNTAGLSTSYDVQ